MRSSPRSVGEHHGGMAVEPLPGVTLERLLVTLREIAAALTNARTTVGGPMEVYNAYIRWVGDAARRLSFEVALRFVDDLVLTQRCWLLQTIGNGGGVPVIVALNAELDDRSRALERAIDAVNADLSWSRQPGVLVVPDTSFYLSHPEKLEEVNLAEVLELRGKPIRMVVPILVVDELDGLKRSGQKQIRWRAAYTLAVFDRLLRSPS